MLKSGLDHFQTSSKQIPFQPEVVVSPPPEVVDPVHDGVEREQVVSAVLLRLYRYDV